MLLVKIYCMNRGTDTEYYGLKNAMENTILHTAPNNWKTEKGAENWAKENGYLITRTKPQNKYNYGYTWCGMLEIEKENAIKLFKEGQVIYLLYPDNTESVVNSIEEIENFNGLFGIEIF